MALRIDQVDTEIEILRKDAGPDASSPKPVDGGGVEALLSTRLGRAELRERLRPIVMEIVEDELARIKRKVGAP